MQTVVAFLKGAERFIVQAELTSKLIKVHFADGFVAKVPLREIHGLPGPITDVSVPGPLGVVVHSGKAKEALPWDWLRAFGDNDFVAQARARSKASAARVGERIRKGRTDLGWSQSALADKCGVDRTTIARAESGEQVPSYPTVVALARAFELSTAELMLDE